MISEKEWVDEWALALDTLPKRLYLYVITFKDKSVYIGLTANPKTRLSQHKANRNIDVSTRINNTPYTLVIHSTVDVKKDLIKEDMLINEYKAKGIKVLNRKSGGGGGFNKTSYVENNFTKLQLAN